VLSTQATLDAAEAAGREWPVVVVGAGPAGAFAAYELARAGVRTLLIDRQVFPRAKVCGGCLNARTLALLAAAGLGDLPASLGGQPLDHFELWTGGRTVRLPMPRGIAVSRAAFDEALVQKAIAAGAEFLPGTRAVLGAAEKRTRLVRLPQADCQVAARTVIAADGLGGSFLPGNSQHRSRPVAGSRIGAGAVLDDVHGTYRPGVIHMAVGKSGYVGVARVEGGRLSVAAALDRDVLGDGRPLFGAVAQLLAEAGLPRLPIPPKPPRLAKPGASASQWRGTAALSRCAPRVAFERVFLIGDAAGYIEPFTGEGISWALEAAREVSSLAARAARAARACPAADTGRELEESLELEWRHRYERRIVRRQRWCRGVSWALRQRMLVAAGARLLGAAPGLAMPLMAHLNAVPEETSS